VTTASVELSFERLARIAVRVGINVQRGQPLKIVAPIAARQFVLRLAKAAYQAGSGLVTCVYEDPELLRLALTDMAMGDVRAAEAGENPRQSSEVATLRLVGPEPSLLAGISLERILALHGLTRVNAGDDGTYVCTMPFVTQDWATAVRPFLAPEESIAALWRDIFALCDVDLHYPPDGFSARLDRLTQVRDWLNGLDLNGIRLVDDETDLHVRPLAGASWSCPWRTTAAGTRYLAELPAGPLRIALDPSATHGVLKIRQPLRIAGVAVCDLGLTFEKGRVVRCEARTGRREFERLIATDEGAARLGAIGVVESAGRPPALDGGFLAPTLDRASWPHVIFGSVSEAADGSRGTLVANRSTLSMDAAFGTDRIEVSGVSPDASTCVLLRGRQFCLS